MKDKTKFQCKRATFTITKDTNSGFYNLEAKPCTNLNYYAGTAYEIANWLTIAIKHAIENMDYNNAKSIKITASWKEDQQNQ